MIKITQSPTYSAPVAVDIPTDKGKTVKTVFTAIFRRVSMEEIEELQERLKQKFNDDGSMDTTVERLKDDELVRDVMVGWGKDVVGDDGEPLEFNDANLTALLNIFPVRPQIVRTFFDTISNARAKN